MEVPQCPTPEPQPQSGEFYFARSGENYSAVDTASRVNDVWAMDFVHDQLATGRKIRVLTVVDTFSRFSPALNPRFSYRGEDVVQTLETTCAVVGYPKTIRVDQGSEFISRDLDLWAYANDVTLDFSRPGKSWRSGVDTTTRIGRTVPSATSP